MPGHLQQEADCLIADLIIAIVLGQSSRQPGDLRDMQGIVVASGTGENPCIPQEPVARNGIRCIGQPLKNILAPTRFRVLSQPDKIRRRTGDSAQCRNSTADKARSHADRAQ
ncbi:hypothetical protein [Nocardia sp. NBC_01388]|uniref:hypothetical protein n=1 Tax=Nocardia sp. NBC_01388 TaxID=2903596 RepID=UPI00386EDDA9